MKNPDVMSPWDFSTPLGSLPDVIAARRPDTEALMFNDQRWTFRQLAGDVDRLAKALIANGVEPGDKCVVWLNNCPEWIHLMFALAKIGAVQVPINTRLRTDDVEYVLRQSNARFLFTHDTSGPIDYLAMVRALVPVTDSDDAGVVTSKRLPDLKRLIVKSNDAQTSDLHPGTLNWIQLLHGATKVDDATLWECAAKVSLDDLLFIMYTSGTTGFPKGVMRDHHLLRNHVDRIEALGTTEDDVVLNYLPLFHIFGYVDGPLLSVMTGCRQVLMDVFDPTLALKLVERERVSQLQGFEAHMKDLVHAQERHQADVSTLRRGVFAAGMQSAVEIIRKGREVLAPLKTISAYGMTEIGANCCLSRLNSTDEQACETSGIPCPGFTFLIVDPATGDEVPLGQPGELWVKTYNVMRGYYQMPELTAAAFTDDGWFKTGDMGYMRADGYFRFVGRYKDMLKIGGENVDPMEVERHLLNHPGVRDVAVVGYPDERLSEVSVAFVKVQEGASPSAAEIVAHCRGRIASFKIPRHVLFVEEIPMTSSGKIRKVELRERALKLIP